MIYRKKQYVGDEEEKLSADIIYGENKRTQTEINANIIDQIPTNTITTTSGTATITDSSNMPLKDIQVLGNATQSGTPDGVTPVSLNIATGEQTVTIVGKNLFDGVVYQADTTFNSSGGTTSSTSYDIYKVFLQPNTTYTLQATQKATLGNGNIFNASRGFGYTASDTQIGILYEQQRYVTNANYISTFTTSNDISYMLLSIRKTDENVQVEIGGTATSYEAYTKVDYPLSLGTIELAVVSNFCDEIYKKNGNWYLKKATKKLVLDGTESWQGTTDYYITSLVASIYPITTEQYIGLGDYFNVYGSGYMVDNQLYVTTNGRLYIKNPSNTYYANASAWTTFLSTNTPTIYYSNKNQPITQITDDTLIGQLEAIKNATTSANSTHFAITPTSPNAPAKLQITSRKDLQTLTDQIATLEARVELLEQ